MTDPLSSIFDRPPFCDETDEEVLFYQTIGRMSVRFAPIEAILDWTSLVAFHSLAEGKHEKTIPRGFARKTAYLRKLHGELATTPWDEQTLLGLLDRLDAAAGTRNDILHAMTLRVSQKLEAEATSVIRGPFLHQQVMRSFSVEEIEDFTRELHYLAGHAVALLKIALLAAGVQQERSDLPPPS